MSRIITPTPITPDAGEDRTREVILHTEKPLDGPMTDCPITVLRERREFDSASVDVKDPVHTEIPATVSDGGMPKGFRFMMSTMLGDKGQATDVTGTGPSGAATVKMDVIPDLIRAAIDLIAEDNLEARKLAKQLEAGDIDQTAYAEAIALLFQTLEL